MRTIAICLRKNRLRFSRLCEKELHVVKKTENFTAYVFIFTFFRYCYDPID